MVPNFLDRRVVAAILAAVVVCPVAVPAPTRDGAAVNRKQLEVLWAELEKEEPAAARALLRLAARPADAVPFVREVLKPLRITPDEVRALLAKLRSNQDDVWRPAFETLEYFDPRLAIDLPTLMNEVTENPARQRMVGVLSGRTPEQVGTRYVDLVPARNGGGFNFVGDASWCAEPLVGQLNLGSVNRKVKWSRAVRAVALLEYFNSPDAVAHLKALADGHPDAQPTKEAKAALARLAEKNR